MSCPDWLRLAVRLQVYPLAEQEVHSLEICFWCYSLFDAIYNESLLAYNVELPREVLTTFHSEGPRFQKGDWAAAKAKIYDFFKESVTRKVREPSVECVSRVSPLLRV